ncbi:MAG: heavy metal translocating P-type ATPase [bacterium]|nr:heavy metal translocating P-type ATPase [bacterium]
MNRPSHLFCIHCLAPITPEQRVSTQLNGQELSFCCHGCEGAYRMIQGAGLGDFYQKRQLESGGKPLATGDLEGLDEDQLILRHAQTQGDYFKMRLVLSGLHCAACVWLNENILEQMPGVIEARVNYSTHKATITWNPQRVNLTQIFETIRSIGYDAHPYSPGCSEEPERHSKERYISFVVALFASMNLMWVAIAQWAGYFQGMEAKFNHLFDLTGFLLATPVVFYSGRSFLKGAWQGLKHGLLGMDFQIAASGLLIWGYSSAAALFGWGETYFEAAVMLITFILGAKLLESLSLKAIFDRGDQLADRLPKRALRQVKGQIQSCPAADIQPGWTLEALPHEPLLADGRVVEGYPSLDESFLTGEATPVAKQPGDWVYATSLNQEGHFFYRVEHTSDQATANRILELIESAIENKPSFERLADRLSRHFVAVISLLALGSFGYWTWALNWNQGFAIAVAVLVIACPCALALATPLAYLSGLAKAAQEGILFKGADGLEQLGEITDLVLDKTGTLSLGRPQVVGQWSDLLFAPAVAQALVSKSSHPVAQALSQYLGVKGEAAQPEGYREVPGLGILARFDGLEVRGGNPDWAAEKDWPVGARELAVQWPEASLFGLAMAGRLVALYALADRLKANAAQTCHALGQSGLKLHLLSGDRPGPVRQSAQEVGIENWHAEQTPQDKLAYVQALQAQGAKVWMAGDGINDAPALAQAQLGLVMGQGAVKSLALADLILLNGDPKGLLRARQIALGTAKLLRGNLALSFGYNLFVVPLALVGWVIPVLAALSMSLSSLLVVLHSYSFGRRA